MKKKKKIRLHLINRTLRIPRQIHFKYRSMFLHRDEHFP